MGTSFKAWISDNRETNAELLRQVLEMLRQTESDGFVFEDLTSEADPTIRIDATKPIAESLKRIEVKSREKAKRAGAGVLARARSFPHGWRDAETNGRNDKVNSVGRFVFDVVVRFDNLSIRRVALNRHGAVVPVSSPKQIAIRAYDKKSGEEVESPEKAIDGLRDMVEEIAFELKSDREVRSRPQSPYAVRPPQGFGVTLPTSAFGFTVGIQ